MPEINYICTKCGVKTQLNANNINMKCTACNNKSFRKEKTTTTVKIAAI